MKKIIALALSALFIFGLLTACGKDANPTDGSSDAKKEYTVGICNYVDDASLNQIVENIQARLEEIGKEKNVTFKIEYDNCNADANLMSQIIANFQADKVDLMVGVATPVAMAMQAATEDTKTPVVFTAVYHALARRVRRKLPALRNLFIVALFAVNVAQLCAAPQIVLKCRG